MCWVLDWGGDVELSVRRRQVGENWPRKRPRSGHRLQLLGARQVPVQAKLVRCERDPMPFWLASISQFLTRVPM
jgi:hypothetical protein